MEVTDDPVTVAEAPASRGSSRLLTPPFSSNCAWAWEMKHNPQRSHEKETVRLKKNIIC